MIKKDGQFFVTLNERKKCSRSIWVKLGRIGVRKKGRGKDKKKLKKVKEFRVKICEAKTKKEKKKEKKKCCKTRKTNNRSVDQTRPTDQSTDDLQKLLL